MIFKIMDVNADGAILADIDSNNGKNALKKFRSMLTNSGMYEIRKSKFNWCMFSTYGGAWYALPVKENGGCNARKVV